jgi:hypothetical protein
MLVTFSAMNCQELSELLQKMNKLLKPSAAMYVNGIPAQKMFQIDDSDKYVVFVVPMLAGPDAAESCAARHPD